MANEKRLIDANVVEKVMNERYKALAAEYVHYDHYTTGYGDALCVVEDAPTVDAVEVAHGYWIEGYNADHMGRIIEHTIDCSVCDSVFKDDSREVVKYWKERFQACPFCGAKMDGGNEDGV